MARRRLRRLVTRGIRWACVPIIAFVLVVAVAMGCAAWSPARAGFTNIGLAQYGEKKLPAALYQYGGEDAVGVEWAGFGVSFHHILTLEATDSIRGSGRRPLDLVVGRAGIPFRCMRWTVDRWHGFPAPPSWAGGIEVKPTPGRLPFARRIPLMPEPVGMVLNVLIVSAALALPRATFLVLVPYRRKRKNLCVHCAYPLGDFAVCPECGKPTRREA